MAVIAPWLTPPNFLAAAESGARIGLEQAGQAEQATEAAGRLGLGYAQLGSENQRAAAAQTQAAAQLKAEQARYNLLEQQANARIGQGQERIDDSQAAHDAADALGQQRLALSTKRADNTNDYHQQMVDVAYQRLEKQPGNYQDKLKLAQDTANDAEGFLADPQHLTNPELALKKYPLAANHKLVEDFFNSRNIQNRELNKPLGPATVTKVKGGSEYRYQVPEDTAAKALGTNYIGNLLPKTNSPAASQATRPAAPGYTVGTTYQNGTLKYLGGDINDGSSWEQLK